MVRSAKTLRVPGTRRTIRSSFAPTASISPRSAPKILIPTGVRTPVVSMSMRPLIGIVQAFVTPGIFVFASSSPTSSSREIRSLQIGRKSGFSQSGAHDEYQRRLGRHRSGGFSTTVVSIIENGAGSVDVSARPAFPNTRSTSGTDLRIRSCARSRSSASVTDSPGSVVGM